MSAAVDLSAEQVIAALPAQLRVLVSAHLTDVASDPIKDKRYVALSRSGESAAEYLTWLQSTGADTASLVKQELALARMCMFRPALAPEEWDSGALLEFVTWVQRQFDLSDATMRTNVFVPLKGYWTWATAWKRLPWNPMALLRPPKRRDQTKVIEGLFSQTDQAKLLLAADQTILAKRDKAAVSLFLDTGARKNDVQELQWRDVNLADCEVFYRHRKGDKEQVIPFGADTQKALLDAFHSEYPIIPSRRVGVDGKQRRVREDTRRAPVLSDYVLFPNGVNGGSQARKLPSWITPNVAMSETAVHRWWYRLLQDAELVDAGANSGRRLHLTRHTHGTELYEATGDVEAVRERLGHVGYETTKLYVHHSRRRGIASVRALEEYRANLREKDR